MDRQRGCQKKDQENDTHDWSETPTCHQEPHDIHRDTEQQDREGFQADVRETLFMEPATQRGCEPHAQWKYDEQGQPTPKPRSSAPLGRRSPFPRLTNQANSRGQDASAARRDLSST